MQRTVSTGRPLPIVAIEIAAPQRDALIVETAHDGDFVAWSWIVPPYRARSDARATSEVSAISLDAVCMRKKCEDNPVLGYQMFKTFVPVVAHRLHSLRMQLLDLYGTKVI